MAKITRRSWFKGSAALAAAAGATSVLPEKAHAGPAGKIILSHVLSLDQTDRIKQCLQMGVRHVVNSPSLRGIGPDQYEAAMKKHKEAWAEAGMKVIVHETMTPVPADNIRRGSPGRDEELRNWIAYVQAMGK